MLTFDDGYLDNYQCAYPILKEYNVTKVFFIVTKYIGTYSLLWHDKIRLLAERGIKSKKEIEQILAQINEGKLRPNEVKELTKLRTTRMKD